MTTVIVNRVERLVLKDIDLNNYHLHILLSFLRQYACYDRCNRLKSIQLNSMRNEMINDQIATFMISLCLIFVD